MASKLPRIAWDSCVCIDALEKREGRYEPIEFLIKDGEAGKLAVVVSALTIAETLHIKGMESQEQIAAIDAFFRNDWLHIYAADEAVARIARDIRRGTALKTEDAIHLATAINMKCDALLTNDGDSPSKRGKLIPLDQKHDIRICTPQVYIKDKFPLLGQE